MPTSGWATLRRSVAGRRARSGNPPSYFALAPNGSRFPTLAVDEIAELRGIHSLPHRRGGMLLGLVNVQGELVVCVSLSRILGFEEVMAAKAIAATTAGRRLVVVRSESGRIAFPVDEVERTQRYDPRDLKSVPATLAKVGGQLHEGHPGVARPPVGCLDDQLVVAAMNRSNRMTARDLSQVSMHDLFRMEAESQTQVLTAGLLALERNPVAADQLEACMRAAHSLKGPRVSSISMPAWRSRMRWKTFSSRPSTVASARPGADRSAAQWRRSDDGHRSRPGHGAGQGCRRAAGRKSTHSSQN